MCNRSWDLIRICIIKICAPTIRYPVKTINNFTLIKIFCFLSLFLLHLFLSVLAELQSLCKQYWNKICTLEGDKWDLERISKVKEFEVKKTAILLECFVSPPFYHSSEVIILLLTCVLTSQGCTQSFRIWRLLFVSDIHTLLSLFPFLHQCQNELAMLQHVTNM